MATKNKNYSKSRSRSANSGSPVRFVGILLLTFFFAVLITCVIMGSNIKKQDETETKNESGVTTEVTTQTPSKQEEKTEPDTSGVEKNNVQNEGQDPSELEELTGYVSHTSAVGSTARIRVVINQLINGTGTCDLTISAPSGNNLKSTVATVDGPSSATCEGFDVDLSGFRETGTFIFQIEVKGNNKRGVISGEVTL